MHVDEIRRRPLAIMQASEGDVERPELFSETDRAAGGETAFVYGMERAKEAVSFAEVDFDEVFLRRRQHGEACEEEAILL